MWQYTNVDNDKLFEIYPKKSKSLILKEFPHRSWNGLRLQAKKLGIKRYVDNRKTKKKTKLEKLIDGSSISFYWLGFLLADGNFRGTKSIRLEISTKDTIHLQKLAAYLCAKIHKSKKRKSLLLEIYNCDVVPEIISLLGLRHDKPKTYYCPNVNELNKLNEKSLFALLIGFIDGDGCISKSKSIYIILSNHKSWMPFYELMINCFQKYSNKILPIPLLTRRGYLRWSCGQKDLLINLKNHAYSMNLPILERKWDKVTKENNAQS